MGVDNETVIRFPSKHYDFSVRTKARAFAAFVQDDRFVVVL